jgi:broad specificity phosphatase PhoE
MAASMRRIVYLARHGETDWNRAGRWQGWTDIPLNETGESQAAVLAHALRERGIVRVVASDLSRARRTAEIVASTLELAIDVELDAGLRERGFGLFEGLTREECAERYPDAWNSYRADAVLPPGTEPHDVVKERMRRAVRRAVELGSSEDGAILVVTHGSALRTFVHEATGTMPPPLSNCAVFRATALVHAFIEIERIG